MVNDLDLKQEFKKGEGDQNAEGFRKETSQFRTLAVDFDVMNANVRVIRGPQISLTGTWE